MWKRKDLKKNAKHSLRLNYIACISVCFIMMFIAGEYQSTVQFILNYDTQNVINLKYDTDQKIEIVKEIEKLCGGSEKLKNAKDEDIDGAVNKVAEKYNITDKEVLRSWVDIYINKGASALNFKEVTFFGTTGESSNWKSISRDIELISSEKIKIEKEIDLKEEELANYFDLATKEQSSKIGVINSIIRLFSQKDFWRTIISMASSIFSLLIAIFVAGPLIVGERRFFLENRTYHKTRVGRMGFLFRERCFRPVWIMFLRDLYKFFWMFTIIGGFIKSYEYEMIPYILAENPRIDRKKAFHLSKQMMQGNKWKSFVIDLSFMPWLILVSIVATAAAILFLGFSYKISLVAEICCAVFMTLFLNPYKTATKTEFYIALRKVAINNKFEYSEELNDKYLDLDLLEEMMVNSNQKPEDEGI